MATTLRGREVCLKVGQITNIEGIWFRVHRMTKRDITFRRLNAEKVAEVERVKAAQEPRAVEAAEAEQCPATWSDGEGRTSHRCTLTMGHNGSHNPRGIGA